MSKRNKKIEAPAIVHSSTEQGQLDYFRETANKVKDKYNTVTNGKGYCPRNCFSDQFLKNYDEINWDNRRT